MRVGAGDRGGRKLAVLGHDEAAVLETLLHLIFGDEAAGELVDDNGGTGDVDDLDGSRVTLGVVQVLVAVLVGRLSGRDGGGANDGEDCLLHCSDD